MSLSLGILLYASLALALSRLRLRQGGRFEDALFCGLFWPMELSRRWIELVVHTLFSVGKIGGHVRP